MVNHKTTKKRSRELSADDPTEPATPEGAHVTTRSTSRKQSTDAADPISRMERTQSLPVEVPISWRNGSTPSQSGPSNGCLDQAVLNETSNREATQAKRDQMEVKVERESVEEVMTQNMNQVHEARHEARMRENPPKFLKESATIQEKIMELEHEWKKLSQENAMLKAEKQSSYAAALAAHYAEKQSYLKAAAAQGRLVKAMEKTAKALEGTVKEKEVLLTDQETRIRVLEGALEEKGAEAAAQAARIKALEAIAKDVKAKLQDMRVTLAKV